MKNFSKSATPDVMAIKKLTQIRFEAAINKFLHMDSEQVSVVANDPNAMVLDKLLASVIDKAINGGDCQRFNFLLDRLIGKVSEKVKHEVPTLLLQRYNSPEQLVLTAKIESESDETLEDLLE